MLGWLQTYRSRHARVGSFRAMPSRLRASSRVTNIIHQLKHEPSALGVGNQLDSLSNNFQRFNLTWIWREIKRESLGGLGVSNEGVWERELKTHWCLSEWRRGERAVGIKGMRYVPWSQLTRDSASHIRGSAALARQHMIERRWTCCLGWRYVVVIRWKFEHLVAHLSLCIVYPL
jgi:hypothetical protein